MEITEIVNILNRFGAFNVRHSGRSLGDHLLNTYELLIEWNAPKSACLGGAFHSIYGTNVFTNKIIDTSNRLEVSSIIGRDVENLVYLFSIANRPKGIDSGQLINYKTGELLEVTPTILHNLRLIEIANLLEQKCSIARFSNLYKIYQEIKQNKHCAII